MGLSSRLNWLRAGVLGANDGIVSTAGLVVGVAAATTERGVIATAGIAGLVAGAVSMALGEYVSVSTQRDTEKAMLAKERRELAESPDEEFAELISMYRSKGLSLGTAQLVARELTDHDAFAAHVDIELGIDPDELTNPWHAAYASAIAFTLGSALPLLAILLPPAQHRGYPSPSSPSCSPWRSPARSAPVSAARSKGKAVMRVVVGGALAMAVTFGIGQLLGAAGI